METTPTTSQIKPPQSTIRQLLPWLVKVLGLGIFLALAVFGVDYKESFKALASANKLLLVAAFGLFCGYVTTQLIDWILIASWLKVGYQRLSSYARVFFVSWFAGLALPKGIAPVTRLAVVAADRRSVGRATVAVFADRLVEVAPIPLVLAVGSIYLSSASTDALRWLLIGGVASTGLIVLSWLLFRIAWPVSRRIILNRVAERMAQELRSALGELRALPPRQLVIVLSISTVGTFLNITSLYLVAIALGVHMSYLAFMAVWAAIAVAALLPISINGLGPREGILAGAFGAAGYDPEVGVALGLIVFAMQTVTRLTAGVAVFIGTTDVGSATPVEETAGTSAQLQPNNSARIGDGGS